MPQTANAARTGNANVKEQTAIADVVKVAPVRSPAVLTIVLVLAIVPATRLIVALVSAPRMAAIANLRAVLVDANVLINASARPIAALANVPRHRLNCRLILL